MSCVNNFIRNLTSFLNCSSVNTKNTITNNLYFIEATEKYPNINLNFNKKLVSGKVEKGEMLMTE